MSEEILKLLGFFDCSQVKMFGFIEDLVNPSYREEEEQKAIVEKLDPLLRLDGFTLAESGDVSGCPIYRIQQTASAGLEPTGWTRVDRSVAEVRKRLENAATEEQFQAVGLLCRETLISLGQAVYDAELHRTLDGVTPSDTDAKRMLEAYIAVDSPAPRTSTPESMLGPPMTSQHICSIEERPRFERQRLARRQQLQL
jgi:hypothetical protein